MPTIPFFHFYQRMKYMIATNAEKFLFDVSNFLSLCFNVQHYIMKSIINWNVLGY